MSARLLALSDATWPAAETVSAGGWLLRRGADGGKRVSSASADPPGSTPDPAPAIAQMQAWGQPVMFRLAAEDEALAERLAGAGYRRFDPVIFYEAPVSALSDGSDETARIIRCAAPLAIAREIFASCGIGPGRVAVMERARSAKTILIARLGDRPAGAAHVGAEEGAKDGAAMIHAISVLPDARRQGAATMLLRGAASWAAEAGAVTLALAVSEANEGARALYESLGMATVGRYHYRIVPEGEPA